ncbi:MAG: DUF4157 domain-containing protein [Clostridiales bacterium]|nr:DUF4157 domain-containing protein [Clostridiales bacterium]
MSYTYAKRKQAEAASPKTETVETQGPSPEALRTGAAQPSAEQLGNRADLPDAMRSKMENAFGADLSAVKLYESQAVADVGSQAITQGADIAFAPGLLDFSSFGGQALLGHEISHVVSQARGEVTGGGFLNDASLEARADREGAMAAAGRTVAPPTASLSPVSAADAAGPMQAKLKPRKKGKDAAPAPAQAAPAPLPETPRTLSDEEKEDRARRYASSVVGTEAYDSARMSREIANLAPVAKADIQRIGKSAGRDALTTGNRFAIMRESKEDSPAAIYGRAMSSAADRSVTDVVAHMYTGLDALPDRNYKEDFLDFMKGGELLPEAAAYQQRALQETQMLLSGLEQNPDAIDALKQAQDMYTGFGTFGEQDENGTVNYAGMNGGREEAAHRAFNDLYLRTVGRQQITAAKGFLDDGGLSQEEGNKFRSLTTAMMHMQGRILKSAVDPESPTRLSEGELAMQDMYRSFFIRTGMMDAPQAAPVSPPPEANSLPPNGPATPALSPLAAPLGPAPSTPAPSPQLALPADVDAHPGGMTLPKAPVRPNQRLLDRFRRR